MQHIKVKTKKNTETNRKLGWRERLKNKKSQQKKWRYGTEGGIVDFPIILLLNMGMHFFYLLGVNFLFYLFIYSFYSHDRGA